MRRFASVLLLALLAIPAHVSAQPRIMVGGGLSTPNGDLSSTADPGYHAQVGLFLPIPTLPIAIRGDGALHKMGAAVATQESTQVLAGSLSLVYTLPGIGLTPYFLGGVGRYRTESGLLGAPIETTSGGYHGGFGVNVGAGGLGFFSEIRFVQIDQAGQKLRLVPLTVGLRF